MGRKWLFVALGVMVALSVLVLILGLHRRPHYIRNFEENEYGENRPFIKPVSINDGLAVYAVGSGEPVLLFPYPHAHTTVPMAQEPLAELLAGLGRTVVTFDVPGAYRSTRDPVGDMGEILRSAGETLDRLNIEGPVDVVGHSMGGLCALAFAIERPERTHRLVLIGSMSGFPASARWGMPGSAFRIWDADYWRIIIWGIRINAGRGNLAFHKKLQNLMEGTSYFDKTLFRALEIDEDDYEKGVPIRMIWGKNMYRRLSYADKLGSVQAPTLVLVGRYDQEASVPCSEELSQGIPDARLVVFERSGHFPFVEQLSLFTYTVRAFIKEEDEVQ
jgi:pimeloyl-ACP methyl ester carboxylesterase